MPILDHFRMEATSNFVAPHAFSAFHGVRFPGPWLSWRWKPTVALEGYDPGLEAPSFAGCTHIGREQRVRTAFVSDLATPRSFQRLTRLGLHSAHSIFGLRLLLKERLDNYQLRNCSLEPVS